MSAGAPERLGALQMGRELGERPGVQSADAGAHNHGPVPGGSGLQGLSVPFLGNT